MVTRRNTAESVGGRTEGRGEEREWGKLDWERGFEVDEVPRERDLVDLKHSKG
jgi:hypothetical protein